MYDFSRTQWQNKSFVADLIFKAATLITRALAGRHLRADISVTCCKLKFWRNESLDDHPSTSLVETSTAASGQRTILLHRPCVAGIESGSTTESMLSIACEGMDKR